MSDIKEPLLPPRGFSFLGRNIGIKDDSLDFGVAYSERPCAAAGVFTRNNFPGAPVIVGREHLAGGFLQAVAVNSKNANVATGGQGVEDSRRICSLIGQNLGIDPRQVLPSSTGVIGVPLPMDIISASCADVATLLTADRDGLERFARAIMTTDTRPKTISLKVGDAILTGVAKGAGMIEPNMATMLAYFFTDARLSPADLRAILTPGVNRSFNRISVDTDTSTSDTVIIMANGLAGDVDKVAFKQAFDTAAVYLAKEIARDGEGATKLIELTVDEAPSQEAALAIAKGIINSPLVKTAIHGADPNWGRFVMAVGKVFQHPVPLEGLRIAFGEPEKGLTIASEGQSATMLASISEYLGGEELLIRVRLGCGLASETVWGCDLSAEYVKINADYTT